MAFVCEFLKMGGSSGTIFAWDLRWQQQPIMLSGPGLGGTGQSPSESEVWEVQYDSHTLSSSTSAPPAKVLPVMMCSEDGILVVLEQGMLLHDVKATTSFLEIKPAIICVLFEV